MLVIVAYELRRLRRVALDRGSMHMEVFVVGERVVFATCCIILSLPVLERPTSGAL